ncbi:hypothetical protein GCM10027578_43020 [Spirosoma luteolum]
MLALYRFEERAKQLVGRLAGIAGIGYGHWHEATEVADYRPGRWGSSPGKGTTDRQGLWFC